MALSGLSHTHITPVTVRARYRMSHEVRCRMRVVEVSREMCVQLRTHSHLNYSVNSMMTLPLPSVSDERPHVLIVGAGPIGLEAAVSCRYAGFRVTIAEKGADIASSVRHWKHVRLFSANMLNNSADGLRALEELGCPAPAPTACPTGAEFADGYLEPLARWLADDAEVRLSTRVDSISRGSLLKGDAIKGAGDHARDRTPFAALLVGANGEETLLERLDAVIDCSGTYGNGTQLRRARVGRKMTSLLM